MARASRTRSTVGRLRSIGLDGLILYDIDDESERSLAERPFPFMPTLDPADYLADHLVAWPTPAVVYRTVGKYPPDELRSWLSAQHPTKLLTVLVGAASRNVHVRTSLADAQALRREANPALSLGGVAIPERHSRRGEEHLGLLAKQAAGCRFFVTQIVYDLNAALRALVPRVLARLVHRGEDFDAAEDALQEALIETLRMWPEHRPRDPQAWTSPPTRSGSRDRSHSLRRSLRHVDCWH